MQRLGLQKNIDKLRILILHLVSKAKYKKQNQVQKLLQCKKTYYSIHKIYGDGNHALLSQKINKAQFKFN